MSAFHLQIVTPEGVAFDGEAEQLTVRTTEGYVGILAGHTDFVAALDVGRATVVTGGERRRAACGGGFLSVESGEVRLVATTFEYAADIDTARAEDAKKRAQAILAQQRDEQEVRIARAKLARALNRLDVASKN